MVFTAVLPCSFQSDHIPRIGYDAQGIALAMGIVTNFTDGIGGEMKAGLTAANFLLGFEQSLG